MRWLPGLGGCPPPPSACVLEGEELWTVAGKLQQSSSVPHSFPRPGLGLLPWPAAFALSATEMCSQLWASGRVAWVLDVSFKSPWEAGGGPHPQKLASSVVSDFLPIKMTVMRSRRSDTGVVSEAQRVWKMA